MPTVGYVTTVKYFLYSRMFEKSVSNSGINAERSQMMSMFFCLRVEYIAIERVPTLCVVIRVRI